MTAPARRTRTRDDIPLADHVRRLGLIWRPVALGALAGAAIGLLNVVATPPVYRSTTSVLVADAPTFLADRANANPKRFSMDTEAQRVMSARILDSVARAVGDPAPVDHLAVTATPNTKILRITYRSRGEGAAARGAERAAAAYLRARSQALETRRDDRVEAMNQELRTLNDRLDATAASGAAASAQRVRRVAISRRIADRQAEIRAVEATSVYPGEIVRRRESYPGQRHNKSVPVTGGLALGGLLGAAVAGLRAARLRAPGDVTRAVPGPAVALRSAGTPRALDPVAGRLAGEPGVYLVAPVDAASGSGTADTAAVDVAFDVAGDIAARLSRSGRRTLLLRAGDGPSGERLDLRRGDAHTARAVAALQHPDTTVLVAAPAVSAADGRLLATLTDGAVLVASCGTGTRDLTAAARCVAAVGTRVEAVVLTPAPRTARPRRRGGAR